MLDTGTWQSCAFRLWSLGSDGCHCLDNPAIISCGTHPTYNSHIAPAQAHVYSLILLEKARARLEQQAKRVGGSPVADRHAVQLRSVHIRISPDRPIGLFFAGKAARADARRDVAGSRLSRVLRLR